jgi:SAM-dependent methyltransferase
MAHPAQRNFCEKVKTLFSDFFSRKRVLDVGSLNINGTIRDLFTDCTYIGIDIAEGNNVDVVSKAHEYKSDELFDVVCSCEAFEHDMYLEQSLKNMVNLLKPEGLFFFTCATENRREHGTATNESSSSPLTSQVEEWKDYYKNVSEDDIRKAIDIDDIFVSYKFYVENHDDLYFWGIKKSV